ncbi:MAG: hypothetical protein M3218_01955 [Thermoproteota archaeon]|nr:hypothetical protein [Thermoproteota archaeon]
MNESSSATVLSRNCASPKGIAVVPTMLIATSTMTTGEKSITISLPKFQKSFANY